MGLITLLFLLALTLSYFGKFWEGKPDFIAGIIDKINANMSQVALWGALYGLVMIVLTLVMGYSGGDMIVRFLANLMIVIMALPFVFERLLAKFESKINPAIATELRNIVGWITRQQKYVSYAGLALCLILFGAVFR